MEQLDSYIIMASVDQPNNEGMIPIIQATIMQEKLVVNCLLELHANVNGINAMKRNALHFAVLGKRGNLDIIKITETLGFARKM